MSSEAISLLHKLKDGKTVHDEFAKVFKTQYLISGKLIEEWKEYFRVNIPPDLNPATCTAFDSKLSDLHQQASFLKAEAEARLAALNNANNQQYRASYTALVEEFKSSQKKLPAKDTLSILAEESIKNTKDSITHAEIELAFWKEVLSDLGNTRRLIENATINLSVEAKAMASGRMLDRLNSNKNEH